MIDKMKISIVIPTWNSMPEFKICLRWIKRSIPKEYLGEIIVVDKHSTDDTIEIAKKYECKVIFDNVSLGSARMKGIQTAESDLIMFIDSDIQISPKWFSEMIAKWRLLDNLYDGKLGMLYGRTIDPDRKVGKLKLWKMHREFCKGEWRAIEKGMRAFTNNTIVKKKLIEDIDISNINAWEDYIITQHILNKGYKVVEVPVPCIHWHSTFSKFGFRKVGWCVSGMFQVAGVNLYTMGYMMYHLLEGIRSTIHFKDLFYLKWGLAHWMDGIKGLWKHNWKRENN